jgi:hypothetical protein
MKNLFLFLVAMLSFTFIACDREGDDGGSNAGYISAANCSGLTPTYNTDVQAIIDGSCAFSGCHNNSGKAEGLTMEGYTNARKSFDNFAILCSINQDGACKDMPQGGGKLDSIDIQTITCWAKNGFPE